MKRSVILAMIIAGVVALWVLSGQIGGTGNGTQASDPQSPEQDPDLFTVKVRESVAELYTHTILIRGRTEALRSVQLKAETEARVVETPVERGQRVEEDELICRLATDQRQADLEQAKALAEQRKLEYEGALDLAEKGHRSQQQVAAAKAQYDAARAQVRRTEVELANTRIVAPFPGIIDARPAEVGDYLLKGSVCARLIQEEPFLVVGEVSEQQVGQLDVGAPADVNIMSGNERGGKIRFIASTANLETRTFRVEVLLANEDRTLREGLSAEIRVPVRQTPAHYIRPSTMVLDSQGRIGVRVVEDGKVVFHSIDILDDAVDGIWVAGLPKRVDLITVGQEFVSNGQTVAIARTTSEIGS